MKKFILGLIILGTVILPFTIMAQVGAPQPGGGPGTLEGIGQKIANAAWVIFTIVAVVMFVIAGILFLTAMGNPEKIVQARNAFLWGVVGVVVAVIAFSITTIISNIIR